MIMEMHEQFMNLNRETAMRLWNKAFGKESKAKDFAGRMIAKGAYNDRNSEFGWNLDHILPQSRGGATADHNLVCCHILTNDEKADSFPCFTANGIPFEVRKVQNHYEIYARGERPKLEQEYDDVDFYDSSAGIRFFEHLKGIQNKKRLIGTVFVYLKAVSNGAVNDFIEHLFDSENISYSRCNNWFNTVPLYLTHSKCNVKITISNFDMSPASDISELLDKCVLLNTYLSSYFLKCKYIEGFGIWYRVDCTERTDVPEIPNSRNLDSVYYSQSGNRINSLYVNDVVLTYTKRGQKVQEDPYLRSEYTLYNFVFTDLEKNLKKEVNEK